MGWGDAHMEGEGENYAQIQVSCEASAGVEGYTCQRPGASLCRLSASLFLSSWTCRSFTTPHLTDPGQLCPAMRGHLWEFIPDASCSPCALISSLFVTAGSIQQSIYMSLLSLLNHLWMLYIFFLSFASSNNFSPIIYIMTSEIVLNNIGHKWLLLIISYHIIETFGDVDLSK